MFASKEYLKRCTGRNNIDRYNFLKLLITEFKRSKSKDAKEQILANLANFAYDPINYGYIRKLGGIDIFLCVLSGDNQDLIRFAIAGICNLCLDSVNKAYILRNQGITLISSLLSSQDEDIIISAITTLMFLVTATSKSEITSLQIINDVLSFLKSTNVRLRNVATIFLNDYCHI